MDSTACSSYVWSYQPGEDPHPAVGGFFYLSLSADLNLPTASVDGNRDCLVPCETAAVVIIPCFQAIHGTPSCVGEKGVEEEEQKG